MFAAAPGNNATFFSHSKLDRLHTLRSQPDALDVALAARDTSRFVPFWKQKALLTVREPAALVTYSAAELCTRLGVASLDAVRERLILLGQHTETREHFWTLELGADTNFAIDATVERAGDVRLVARDLFHAPEWAAVLCHARALAGWHSTHPFCSMCGSQTRIAEVGMKRVCTSDACKTEHFPRTDSVVIALVVRGEHALLGRQKVWPAGRYSCVAGFVDAGENVEQAVAREVHEETGVRVTNVRFFTSQAWPSYSQLMLGCIAEAAPDAQIHLNDKELEDARWFSRDELAAAAAKPDIGFLAPGDGTLMLPGKWAIARDLIEAWLAGKSHL